MKVTAMLMAAILAIIGLAVPVAAPILGVGAGVYLISLFIQFMEEDDKKSDSDKEQ